MSDPSQYMLSALDLAVLCDNEEFPLAQSLTVGRHLDNDIVVAGEDVMDYHARFELTARGAVVHPLLDATIAVDDQAFDKPVNITPASRVVIGQDVLSLKVQHCEAGQPNHWFLVATNGDQVEIDSSLRIGRTEQADLTLDDDHVSRDHAVLYIDDVVWLTDLNSANGTFVNGERLTGGVLLYHGDLVGFDTHRFQLVGRGGDLTPVIAHAETTPNALPMSAEPRVALETTQFGVVDFDNLPPVEVPGSTATGAFLLGASDPITGVVYHLKMGTQGIGRDPESSLVIIDPTVSNHHAQLVTRAEGTSLTNLMATNGTSINGKRIDTQLLQDGDIVRLGQVRLVYKDVPAGTQSKLGTQRTTLLLGAVVSLGLIGAITWWFNT